MREANPRALLPLWDTKKSRELGRVARWLVVFVLLFEDVGAPVAITAISRP